MHINAIAIRFGSRFIDQHCSRCRTDATGGACQLLCCTVVVAHTHTCVHTHIKAVCDSQRLLENQQFKGICVLVGDSLSFRQFSTLTQSASQQGSRTAGHQDTRAPGHQGISSPESESESESQSEAEREPEGVAGSSCCRQCAVSFLNQYNLALVQ